MDNDITVAFTYGRTVTGNAHASCAGDQEFESQASQILHSVINGLLPLQHYASSCIAPWRYDVKMITANSLHSLA